MELALFYGEIPEEKRLAAAQDLHERILGDAGRVVVALCDLCEKLKVMRDEKLWKEMGAESFDAYVEEQVGIRSRQAYNYIATYERLGRTALQSNAHLGITKLQLLTEVSDVRRAEFVEEHDLEGMSVREIKELVAKSKQQADQISLLQETVEKTGDAVLSAELRARDAEKALAEIERDYSDAVTRAGEANQKIRELEARPIEVVGITEEEKKALVEETEARYRKEIAAMKARYSEEKAEAVENAVEDVKSAHEADIAVLEEKHRREIEQIRAEKPKGSSAEGIVREVNVWFRSMNDAYTNMIQSYQTLREENPDMALKVKALIAQTLEQMREGL